MGYAVAQAWIYCLLAFLSCYGWPEGVITHVLSLLVEFIVLLLAQLIITLVVTYKAYNLAN